MFNNDLSNKSGYSFGIRCEDTLIKYQKEKLSDKILNLIAGKNNRAYLDDNVLTLAKYIYRRTDYTVDLVLERCNNTSKILKLLEDVPHNRLILIDKVQDISRMLVVCDLTYYVDNNTNTLSLVNNHFAISVGEVFNVVRQRQERDYI